MSSLADKLRRNGISATAQRVAVLRSVSDHPHVTADQIAEQAAESLGVISRQSVYDTLGLLVDKGLLRKVQPIGSPALYEDRVGDNHHHVICRQCGAIGDVDCAVGRRPCLHASNDLGFIIDEADVTYWGMCPSCAKPSRTSTSQKSRPTNQKSTSRKAQI